MNKLLTLLILFISGCAENYNQNILNAELQQNQLSQTVPRYCYFDNTNHNRCFRQLYLCNESRTEDRDRLLMPATDCRLQQVQRSQLYLKGY